MHRALRLPCLTLALLALGTLSACSSTDEVASAPTSNETSAIASEVESPPTDSPSNSQPPTHQAETQNAKMQESTEPSEETSQHSQAAIDPAQEETPIQADAFAYDLSSLPKTQEGATISVFTAEITDASWGEVRTGTAHVLPGSSALRVTVKLTNISDQPVDASPLSFPTLELADSTQFTGAGDSENPTENTFGTIAPEDSKELTIAFPLEHTSGNFKILLTDPGASETSTTLTHTFPES